jgi:hypothetical protein
MAFDKEEKKKEISGRRDTGIETCLEVLSIGTDRVNLLPLCCLHHHVHFDSNENAHWQVKRPVAQTSGGQDLS